MTSLNYDQKNKNKLEMCPKDTDAPSEKLKRKLLTPQKLKHKLLCHLGCERRRMDGQGQHYMPFPPLNGEGIKKTKKKKQKKQTTQ